MFFENIKIGFDKLMNLILLDSRPLKTNKLDFMLREISIREKKQLSLLSQTTQKSQSSKEMKFEKN